MARTDDSATPTDRDRMLTRIIAARPDKVFGAGAYEGNQMRAKQKAAKNIDEYIAGFSDEVQAILKKIRMTIRKAAPQAQETISYQIPAFTLKGHLVYFAAFKNHIGFYPPVTGGDAKFKSDKAVYEGPNGNLRFPLDKPIPYALISKIVMFRLKENLARAQAKGHKK